MSPESKSFADVAPAAVPATVDTALPAEDCFECLTFAFFAAASAFFLSAFFAALDAKSDARRVRTLSSEYEDEPKDDDKEKCRVCDRRP